MAKTAPDVIWRPQPGPQAALVCCPVSEIFYGGARGGGKTDGMIGKNAIKAERYGKHQKGIFFRRELPQLEAAIERCKELYQPLGWQWAEQKKTIYHPNGAFLKFRPLERDSDAEKYQGHDYCVALGTEVRMGDGSLCRIEDIQEGDQVLTLEGPKKVLRVTEPYKTECVEYRVFDDSREVGRQVHPATHPVMTSVAAQQPLSHDDSQSALRPQKRRTHWHSVLPHPCGGRANLATSAWIEGDPSCCTGFADEYREFGRLLLRSVPVRLAKLPSVSDGIFEQISIQCRTGYRFSKRSRETHPLSRSVLRLVFSRLRGCVEQGLDYIACFFSGLFSTLSGYAQHGRLQAVDSGFDCLSDHRFCDGQPRHRSVIGQVFAPLPNDAETQDHDGFACDEMGCIREYSQTMSSAYIHPYTGERRHQAVQTESGRAEVYYVGEAWVSDLTVEDANHYITKSRLINMNTDVYFEELTNYPDPKPVNKLRGTLRSGAGVPCQFHGSGNPGGPGHNWVRARYIDPAPQGFQIISETFCNPFTGQDEVVDRVFIPAKLSDNPLLLASDPGYVGRLHQTGSAQLVKAWLNGDWSIIEGAFFDCWSEKLVLRPFEIPDQWMRFRSFDWGSARPFSVGWWAVASDDYIHQGQRIRRGAMVRYREWYGMKAGEPNVGLKMTAETVAKGIKDREQGDDVHYGVADPSIFAEDGGPSIAERMGNESVFWTKADNRRVARDGSIGGWDQMRDRMIGTRTITDEGQILDDGQPMVFTFSNCVDSIRTIPVLQHDSRRAEDIDTEAEDHAADEWRYGCMSRPWVREKPPTETPNTDAWGRTRSGGSWKTT